jgi:hypothetical protein
MAQERDFALKGEYIILKLVGVQDSRNKFDESRLSRRLFNIEVQEHRFPDPLWLLYTLGLGAACIRQRITYFKTPLHPQITQQRAIVNEVVDMGHV